MVGEIVVRSRLQVPSEILMSWRIMVGETRVSHPRTVASQNDSVWGSTPSDDSERLELSSLSSWHNFSYLHWGNSRMASENMRVFSGADQLECALELIIRLRGKLLAVICRPSLCDHIAMLPRYRALKVRSCNGNYVIAFCASERGPFCKEPLYRKGTLTHTSRVRSFEVLHLCSL